MMRGLAALILLSSLSLIQTSEVPLQLSLTVLEHGANVHLTCTTSEESSQLFFWYKMNIGYMIQTVAWASFNKLNLKGQFDNPRFKVTKQGNLYSLIILNVSKEDEAIYFCQAGGGYTLTFLNGTVLTVNDDKNQQKYVKQSPKTESVQQGDSVTLQCSLFFKYTDSRDQCPGEQSVQWFRAGSGTVHPGIVYTHSNRSDEQKERSCVYSLFKTIQDSSDAGTYYCAVVTCGEILFGEGTKVEIRQEMYPAVIVLGTLLPCCVIAIVALIFSRKQKHVCEQCKEVPASNHTEHYRAAVYQSNDQDGAAVNYAALDFTSRKSKSLKSNSEIREICIYTSMRDCR